MRIGDGRFLNRLRSPQSSSDSPLEQAGSNRQYRARRPSFEKGARVGSPCRNGEGGATRPDIRRRRGSSAGPMVRIRLPPAESPLRTQFRAHGHHYSPKNSLAASDGCITSRCADMRWRAKIPGRHGPRINDCLSAKDRSLYRDLCVENVQSVQDSAELKTKSSSILG